MSVITAGNREALLPGDEHLIVWRYCHGRACKFYRNFHSFHFFQLLARIDV